MTNQNTLINNSIELLLQKIQNLNISELNISEYNKGYLSRYKTDFSFYMYSYFQLLNKSLKIINKSVSECTFIDYGGGCGILSYLAKLIGFKTVIYNDIYNISTEDVKVISKAILIDIDYFICGDASELVSVLQNEKINPDLICSFDVLEHIYDLNNWIKTMSQIENELWLICMTNANPRNIFIKNRIKKIHYNAEYIGCEKTIEWKNIDLHSSFLNERRKIIANKFPMLKQDEVNTLASKTRGLKKEDIEKVVNNFLVTGKINYKINHPSNTCDPYTGNWAEKLIDLVELVKVAQSAGFDINFSNSLYGYSKNKLLNVPKYLLNLFIKISRSDNLFFSPAFTLEMHKYKK